MGLERSICICRWHELLNKENPKVFRIIRANKWVLEDWRLHNPCKQIPMVLLNISKGQCESKIKKAILFTMQSNFV